QALAACAEVRGHHEDALGLTLEAQDLVEELLAGVEPARRQSYLDADPLRSAALRGDSPLVALGVCAQAGDGDSGEGTPPAARERYAQARGRAAPESPLLQAMIRSMAPTIEPAPRRSPREQAPRASEALLVSSPRADGAGGMVR